MTPLYALTVLTVLLGLALLLSRRSASRPAAKARLGVECLEGRLTPSTYKVANIQYGTDPKYNVLDVYSDTTYTNAPIVVMVHGGAWVMGSKTLVENWYSSYFLAQGFVVVAPQYRLVTPNGTGGYNNQFPIPVDDVAAATSWIVANAATYHANPNEIVMLGTSAGAQIAGMIAFDPTGFNNWGLATPLHIAGFIGDSGPYDWPVVIVGDFHNAVQNYLGYYFGYGVWGQTEPITFATPGAPPSLIIDGTNDNTTHYQNSTDFVNALQGAGDQVTYELYTGYGHTHFSQIFATDTAEQQVVTTYLQSIGL